VVSTPLKNISQNGNLPQIGVKTEILWNHHPVYSMVQTVGIQTTNNQQLIDEWPTWATRGPRPTSHRIVVWFNSRYLLLHNFDIHKMHHPPNNISCLKAIYKQKNPRKFELLIPMPSFCPLSSNKSLMNTHNLTKSQEISWSVPIIVARRPMDPRIRC